ncbi:DUF1801 domain-containing protein [Spiractinospora alimapuensis]|uniref:DUF1801 domain-containing protein n=1 Tax=Spiractinospora alimapuensis TaxID=2820884 RepID=UPI001F16E5F9|nr:DUF1801 domain-containing protein [Spiractinospora alimapuensis]QVQ50205.1 DUF1801 domain-containing protein [Spiractinospora alimapuensis]
MTNTLTVADYVASRPEEQREIATLLLPVIEEVLPGAGAVWHGHPVWSLGARPGQSPVCHIKGFTKYVTFGLWRGQDITDPSGRLEPGARRMAAVKLHTSSDVDVELFAGWLRQACALE